MIFDGMGNIGTATRELSILISEDSPANQFLIQKAIGELSREVDLNLVFNNEQLLDFLLKDTLHRDLNRQAMPDLIIAAYSEPFCDLKIIADIRKRDQFANIPIVVFVNENISNTACKFLEYGVTRVLQKPGTYRGLKKEIQKIITAYA